jgi:SAM-dependent methyltransferase
MTPPSTTSEVHIPRGMDVRRVKIRKYPVSALAASVRADYEAKFGEPPPEPGGWFHPDDWHRVSYVAEVLRPGGDLLDVGAGAGQFLNMLARSGKYRSVVGIDKARFKKYTELEPNMSKLDGDIANLQFEDDSFDVVTCMEVLEHIPPEVLVAGLAELRRVCRGQLIMSLPFCESEPLSRTHLRRFEAADILEMFPNASYTLLDRPRMPWMIMEERFDGTTPGTAGDRAAAVGSTTYDARDATIAQLRAELEALQSRKVVRAANLIGRGARRVRSRLHRC